MHRRQIALIFAFWTLLGLLETSKDQLSGLSRPRPVPVSQLLLNNLPWWYTWALFTPPILLLAQRLRLDGVRRRTLALRLSLHLLAALLLAMAHLLIAGTTFYKVYGHRTAPSLRALLRSFFDMFLMTDLITYITILGGGFAVDYFRRYRAGQRAAAELRLQAAELQARMSEAQLAALRAELQPHFLFNTLNAIAGLVRRREHDAAVEMLAQLGQLLRATLSLRSAREVPLQRELDLLESYLAIERTRFADRLRVELRVDASARAVLVPPLLLQPLVENAVRHGVAHTTGPAAILVSASGEGQRLLLSVEDSGPGLRGQTQEGIGLANTRARLAQLHGPAAELLLEDRPGGGARVRVRLPWRVGEPGAELVLRGAEAAP